MAETNPSRVPPGLSSYLKLFWAKAARKVSPLFVNAPLVGQTQVLREKHGRTDIALDFSNGLSAKYRVSIKCSDYIIRFRLELD